MDASHHALTRTTSGADARPTVKTKAAQASQPARPSRVFSVRTRGQRSSWPRMNASTFSLATSSLYCSGGDFMK